MQSLNDRFIDNPIFFDLFSILPPNEPRDLSVIEDLYQLNNLSAEVKLWRRGLSNNDKSITDMLESTYKVNPSVHLELQITLALPATSVEAERSFSCLRIIKLWLRSTMTTDRLSGLAVIHAHSNKITEDFIAEIVKIMSSSNRRLDF